MTKNTAADLVRIMLGAGDDVTDEQLQELAVVAGRIGMVPLADALAAMEQWRLRPAVTAAEACEVIEASRQRNVPD